MGRAELKRKIMENLPPEKIQKIEDEVSKELSEEVVREIKQELISKVEQKPFYAGALLTVKALDKRWSNFDLCIKEGRIPLTYDEQGQLASILQSITGAEQAIQSLSSYIGRLKQDYAKMVHDIGQGKIDDYEVFVEGFTPTELVLKKGGDKTNANIV